MFLGRTSELPLHFWNPARIQRAANTAIRQGKMQQIQGGTPRKIWYGSLLEIGGCVQDRCPPQKSFAGKCWTVCEGNCSPMVCALFPLSPRKVLWKFASTSLHDWVTPSIVVQAENDWVQVGQLSHNCYKSHHAQIFAAHVAWSKLFVSPRQFNSMKHGQRCMPIWFPTLTLYNVYSRGGRRTDTKIKDVGFLLSFRCEILHDASCQYGFLHRLDIPSALLKRTPYPQTRTSGWQGVGQDVKVPGSCNCFGQACDRIRTTESGGSLISWVMMIL